MITKELDAVETCLDELLAAASVTVSLGASSLLDVIIKRASAIFDALSAHNGEPDAALAHRLLETLQSVTPLALEIQQSPFKLLYLRLDTVHATFASAAEALEVLATDLAYQGYSLVCSPLGADIAAAQSKDLHRLLDMPRADLFNSLGLKSDDVRESLVALEGRMNDLDQSDAPQPLLRQTLQHVHAAIAQSAPVQVEAKDELDRLAVTAADFQMTNVLLGNGGFGEVLQALWLSTGTKVAIKMLKMLQGHMRTNRTTVDLVAHEARVWSNLQHPHVLPLLGVCLTCDVPFLVMPLMAGGDLTRYAPGRPDEHLRLLHEAAQGMAYLHCKHIFHGDLKGNNILVDGYGRVQVCDFGQARALSAASRASTFQQGTVGNVRWVAPERYKRKAVYQLEPDVFAFAMVMYEVASGLIPFHDESDWMVIMGSVLSGGRPSMPDGNVPAYLPWLWPLIELCWSGDCKRRPVFTSIVFDIEEIRTKSLLPLDHFPRCKVVPSPLPRAEPPCELAPLPPSFDVATSPTSTIPVATPVAVDLFSSFEYLTMRAKLAGDLELWTQRVALAAGEVSSLKLVDMPVGTVGMEILGHTLRQPTHALTQLVLIRCDLHYDDVVRLAATLPAGLTTLELDGNVLQDDGVCELSLRLSTTQLAILSLAENDFGDVGMESLARNLPSTLVDLQLWGNRIGDAGVRALADHFPHTVKKLDLSSNAIGDSGVQALLPSLPATLTQLDLSENQIEDDGAAAIAAWLPTTVLKQLDLVQNQIGPDAMAALRAASRPPTLRNLDLEE
ncbi:kinase-like domain-containing protein [Blastocladiella britannica]|nr:kinase-like domain-containing protein [Blastocladiella britannica]